MFITGALRAIFNRGTLINSSVKATPYSSANAISAIQPSELAGSAMPPGIKPLAPATSMLVNTTMMVSMLRTEPRIRESL